MALLEVQDLHKTYGHGRRTVPAVRGVSFTVDAGETLALVGESGCGKSSTARVVAGLTAPTSGHIRLDGQPIPDALGQSDLRRRLQMVFQHPDQSLNPRYRVRRSVAEPLQLLGGDDGDPTTVVRDTIASVGLSPDHLDRLPRQLSGGQQQRVAIARALVTRPDLVVLDEPTASLDQSVRARILSLLRHIQRDRHVGYLFISHDLVTVRRLADRVAVMYLGRIVEIGPTETVFTAPQHPYTQALLAAAPSMDPRRRRRPVPLPGETPSPSALPPGCAFQNRCPLVHDRCREEEPQLLPVAPQHEVECFAVTDDVASTAVQGTGDQGA